MHRVQTSRGSEIQIKTETKEKSQDWIDGHAAGRAEAEELADAAEHVATQFPFQGASLDKLKLAIARFKAVKGE